MSMMISNEIEGMIDSGEITLEEVEELAGEVIVPPEEEPLQEEEKKPVSKEKTPKKAPEAKPKTKTEVVKKASDKVAGGIPFEDKEAMMKLISSRLTKADIQYLTSLVAGGLDPYELEEAAQLAYSRFSSAEIVEVKKFWHRYKSSVVKKK